jgi:hypothetical protein
VGELVDINMRQAFIIMQIGNSSLDEACAKAIVPALQSCGFEPKRVDKHNEGRLLKSEIIRFIESSDIIVADLTNERPNCYLEVGYAMGLDKFRNLIMTAREDHNKDSPNYKKEGPKIHFDLSGYDILFWDPKALNTFRDELAKRIKRRLASVPSITPTTTSPWDNDWISKHQEKATQGLKDSKLTGFMEIRSTLLGKKPNITQSELLRTAQEAEIHTFGWPIGITLNNKDEYRPRPVADGIVAEIPLTRDRGDISYDYWGIKKDASFYLLKSLFEDMRKPGMIFFNTRIVRMTEAILYLSRLYSGLKIPRDSRFLIKITHGGLKGRGLTATGERHISWERKSVEDEISTEIETSIEEIEANLVEIVEQFTKPLFEVFDFFKISRSILEEIVNNFVNGKIT